jgi:enhancing lycopene biosynthesis protein 2
VVNPQLLHFAQAMHHAGKPIGLICIAPAMAAKICGSGAQCTIGNDEETAGAIVATGAEHVVCDVSDIHVDVDNKLVTTPAYMLAQSITEAKTGIDKLVAEVLAMA